MTRRRHRFGCRHCRRVRALGRDYQCQRAAWEAEREVATAGYAAEVVEYGPGPTFRDYLVALAGTGYPMSGREPQAARWAA